MTGLPDEFDVSGPLPGPGVTVLEASAGTGKTFTIAALTARLVADGVSLSKILAVTFTRMATGELRDRVRERLVSAEAGLALLLEDGTAPIGDDVVLRLLAEGARDVVEQRRERLSDALATFDAATITTTHGFCQLVLAGLGVRGRVATGAEVLEDPRDVVDEVVDDLYVRGVMARRRLYAFGRRDALRIGRAALNNPVTLLVPDPAAERATEQPNYKARLAAGVRREVERRLLDANLLTYDDLLVRLADTLNDAERGGAARAVLREKFDVVLVDEFQDTDPVQWNVVRAAFGSGGTTLVLIGDPKQAVYAFRGGDVFAYLDAVRLAGRRFSLDENWRSDEGLIEAFNVLLSDVHLGHPEIPYRIVRATAGHHRPGMTGAPVAAPLRARVLHSEDHPDLRTTSRREIQKGAGLEWVAADVASDIVGLLRSGAKLVDQDRPVEPGDVAVLVQFNRQAGIVQRALRDVGVPAVVAGTESVFATQAARQWLSLLEGLEQPADRAKAVAVALTPFIGMTAAEAAGAADGHWDDVHARLHRWAEVLRRRGVASLYRTVTTGEGLPGRVLAEAEGERALTDLAHVAQLLHAEATASQLGPPALRAWLARRIEQAGEESTEAEERSRRLDSDAAAVQVLTIHRAKGLEFPVVYCPFLFDPGPDLKSGGPVVFHDGNDGWARKLDLGVDDSVADLDGAKAAYKQHHQAYKEEERGEDLRLLYVALTRAKHQCVIWWARVYHCQHSPLGRLLLARDLDGSIPPDGAASAPKDDKVHDALVARAQRAPGRISVERAAGGTGERWEGPSVPAEGSQSGPAVELRAAGFERGLDLRWRRTSYSGITAAAHDEMVDSEPEDPGLRDEPGAVAGSGPVTPVASPTADWTSVWSELPAGAEFGTFVHGVLERTDFAVDDVDAELRRAIDVEHAERPIEGVPAETLISGLVGVLSTPLGPAVGDVHLGEIGRSDRLDEMGFELPLCGGDSPDGPDREVLMSDLASLFSEYGAASPLPGYGDRVAADPLLGSHLRGYLSGSLDLVFRHRGRYYVADYKTNRLAPAGERLTAWHYRPDALVSEMQRAHYPLQAALYLVALHRYLRWRLAGYEPEHHLGGALYLFLRGMTGPDAPVVGGQTAGVFSWQPSAEMVVRLSDLLATGGSNP